MQNAKRRSKQSARYLGIIACMLITLQFLFVNAYAAENQENLEKVAKATAILDKVVEAVEAKEPAQQEPVQVALSKQEVLKGTSTSVTVKVTNEDKLVGTKAYYSSNPKVATIDATGKVTVKGIGETVITITYSGDEEHNPTFGSAVLSVTQNSSFVKKTAQKEFEVALSTSTAKAGVDVIPKVQITGAEKLVGTRTYHSSNPDVATINVTTGKLLIMGEGTTVISVVYSGDSNRRPVMASTLLNVNPALQLTLDQDVVQLGSKEIPEVTVIHEEGLCGTKSYQSSNPKVATIDAKTGKIDLVGLGDTVISVTYSGEKGKHGLVVSSDILRVTKNLEEAQKEDQARANAVITSATVEKGTNIVPEIEVTNEDELVGNKTYQSSNPKVAKVDSKTGKLTIVGNGTTIISVIFSGDETYKATVGSVALEVKPASIDSAKSGNDGSSGTSGDEGKPGGDQEKPGGDQEKPGGDQEKPGGSDPDPAPDPGVIPNPGGDIVTPGGSDPDPAPDPGVIPNPGGDIVTPGG